mmetsp:Transcript_142560/g.397211  ORF Transcript_142560/g.397211 Transcript_142560/m.397211 type:complete len:261 (+) Transcript_142560:49-831(+)
MGARKARTTGARSQRHSCRRRPRPMLRNQSKVRRRCSGEFLLCHRKRRTSERGGKSLTRRNLRQRSPIACGSQILRSTTSWGLRLMKTTRSCARPWSSLEGWRTTGGGRSSVRRRRWSVRSGRACATTSSSTLLEMMHSRRRCGTALPSRSGTTTMRPHLPRSRTGGCQRPSSVPTTTTARWLWRPVPQAPPHPAPQPPTLPPAPSALPSPLPLAWSRAAAGSARAGTAAVVMAVGCALGSCVVWVSSVWCSTARSCGQC